MEGRGDLSLKFWPPPQGRLGSTEASKAVEGEVGAAHERPEDYGQKPGDILSRKKLRKQ